jgi:hypothetical protein
MTPFGWIFMGCSVGLVLFLLGYCFWAILTKPKAQEDLHAPQTIDTRDRDT